MTYPPLYPLKARRRAEIPLDRALFQRHGRNLLLLALLVGTSACALTKPPSADELAGLPVVVFPDTPPKGDFILKLRRGQPIPVRVAVSGSLLTNPVEQTLTTSIVDDLYVHKQWASRDGKCWLPASDVVGVDLSLALPSDAHPKPGEISLKVDRKDRP